MIMIKDWYVLSQRGEPHWAKQGNADALVEARVNEAGMIEMRVTMPGSVSFVTGEIVVENGGEMKSMHCANCGHVSPDAIDCEACGATDPREEAHRWCAEAMAWQEMSKKWEEMSKKWRALAESVPRSRKTRR